MIKLFAQLISQIFGPFSFTGLILIPLLLFNLELPSQSFALLFLLLFISYFVYPGFLFVYFYKKGKISDLDVSVRAERKEIYLLALVGFWAGVIIGYPLGSPLLATLLFLLAITVTITTLFTFVEKVSAHMAINTSAYFLINLVFAWKYWWLFSILLAVAWSRWYLKRHTIHQLVLGTLIPMVVFLTGKYFLL